MSNKSQEKAYSDSRLELKGKTDSIQVLRILAAVCLAIYHMGGVHIRGLRLQMGVNLLYCISAFLLMYTTQDRRKSRSFFLRRLVRIIPLYWIVTVLTFVAIKIVPSLAVSQGIVDIKQLVYSLFFIPYNRTGMNGDYVSVRPIVGPAWTLYWDIYFAVIFTLVMRINHKRRGVIASAICLFLASVGLVCDCSRDPLLSVVFSPFWCNFALGIIAFEIVNRFWSRVSVKTPARVNGASVMIGLVFLGVAYFVITDQPVTALLCTAAFVLVLFGARNHSFSKKTVYLGKLTYSFYLIHYYVIIIVGRFVNLKKVDLHSCLAALFIICLTFVLSDFSFRIVEKRFGKKLRAKLRLYNT